MKHNFLFVLLAFLLLRLSAQAVPARPGAIERVQPDGSTITLMLNGDEHFHYLTTTDGTWVERNASGYYVPMSDEAFAMRRVAGEKRRAARRVQPLRTAAPVNLAPRGLVILANFSDKAMQSSNTQAAFDEMLNGDTYTFNGSYSSARQYFKDQSYGKYVPDFDVVGPVTAPNNMAYYGANDADGYDQRPEYLIRDVCKLVDSQVDFSRYDADKDGYVDFVFVIYAGYGEADGGAAETIWPHQWDFQSAGISLTLDGKKISSYACAEEISYSSKKRSGIGTFCHEFSHVLGLRDLYATNDANHKTMGMWDIMDMGSYNNDGYTPPSYSAYERFMLGWLTPTVLSEAASPVLREIQNNPEAYIITSTGAHNLDGADPNPTTFYMLENRQQTGWDEYLPGHGMLITKVNYSYNAWWNNTINNTASSQRVDLIEADGKTPTYSQDASGYFGKQKDAFPAGATSYTPYSTYPITHITESAGIIAFDFMGGGGYDVKGVTLNATSDLLFVGETLQLTATVRPTTAVNKNVTWSTSDAAVATVSSTGLVTAHACGTAIITVRTEDGGYTATCEVEVPCEYTVTVNSNNEEWGTVTGGGIYYDGDKATLTATAKTGYVFTQWSDGNMANPRTLTVTADITLEAQFAEKDAQSFAIAEGRYVVVCQRSATTNFVYMTGNLGSSSTKRYQAVDANTADITKVVAKDKEELYVWEVVYGTEGILLKNCEQYSTWTSGNSANFSDTGKELTATRNANGSYKLSLVSEPTRVLSLNNTASNNFFAYYGSVQKQDLYFLPYTESASVPTDIETAISEKDAVRKVYENGTIYIVRDGERYMIDGRKID